MGMTLMADDIERLSSDLANLSRGLGRVEALVQQAQEQNVDLKKHLLRQDDVALMRDQQLEINKREAIKAREEKDARDEARFRVLDEKATLTGGRVSVLEKFADEEVKPVLIWHRDEGSKLGGRVSTLEQLETARATAQAQADKLKAGEEGEKRGFWRTWGLLVGLVTAVAAFIGWLGADRLSALLFRLAVTLGGGHG